MSLALLSIATFVIITVLITLQFPSIMSSPWVALSFASCFTAVMAIASLVGGEVAPLPLYALIMVNIFNSQFIAFKISLILFYITSICSGILL
jgi:ABC-type uncharacterized transport system permease subunit